MFRELPLEISLQIANHLNKQDFGRLSRVSKSEQQFFSSRIFWVDQLKKDFCVRASDDVDAKSYYKILWQELARFKNIYWFKLAKTLAIPSLDIDLNTINIDEALALIANAQEKNPQTEGDLLAAQYFVASHQLVLKLLLGDKNVWRNDINSLNNVYFQQFITNTTELIKFFVEKESAISISDAVSPPELFYDSAKEILEALMLAGAENLLNLIINQHPNIVHELFKYDSVSFLALACENLLPGVVATLLDHGAPAHLPDTQHIFQFRGSLIYRVTDEMLKHGNVEASEKIIRLLQNKGADPSYYRPKRYSIHNLYKRYSSNLTPEMKRVLNLLKTNIWQANFVGAPLAEAQLENAYLIEANLTDADLTSANLKGAMLREATLVRAQLTNACLENTYLNHAILSGANLQSANLLMAKLSHTNLRDANLENARLVEANLKYSNLSCANLNNANLSFSDLRHANLSDATFTNADFTSTLLDQAIFISDLTPENIQAKLDKLYLHIKDNPARWEISQISVDNILQAIQPSSAQDLLRKAYHHPIFAATTKRSTIGSLFLPPSISGMQKRMAQVLHSLEQHNFIFLNPDHSRYDNPRL